jgi:hypothetical protein
MLLWLKKPSLIISGGRGDIKKQRRDPMSGMCRAKTRSNEGKPCSQPAMANGRCRFHGGKSTGPRTKEGKGRVKSAHTKHGFYTIEAIGERKRIRKLMKLFREIS